MLLDYRRSGTNLLRTYIWDYYTKIREKMDPHSMIRVKHPAIEVTAYSATRQQLVKAKVLQDTSAAYIDKQVGVAGRKQPRIKQKRYGKKKTPEY